MATRRNSGGSRGRTATKGASKGLVITVVAVLLAAVLTVTAAIGSLGFTKKDPKTWFNNWGHTASQEHPEEPTTAKAWGKAIDDKGNELGNVATYAMPAAMSFYSDIDESAIATTALDYPEVTISASHNFEFNNIPVDWSVSYADGSTGTPSEVDVMTESDGSLTATVRCKSAFNKQILLKVALHNDPDVYATTTIDYIKRITSISDNFWVPNDLPAVNQGIIIEPYFGAGTIKSELKISSIQFSDSHGFIYQKMQKYLTFNIESADPTFNNLALTEDPDPDCDEWFNHSVCYDFSDFITGFNDYDEAHKQAIYYAWYHACKELKIDEYQFVIDLKIDVIYNNNVIQSYYGSDIDYKSITGAKMGANLIPDLTLNTAVGF